MANSLWNGGAGLTVDWAKLQAALNYYQENGFTYVEVPWLVSPNITCMTFEKGAGCFSTTRGDLIGSAEQGFLSILDSLESNKHYVALTPCFRDEPYLDKYHQYYFMKVELFVKQPKSFKDRLNLFSFLALKLAEENTSRNLGFDRDDLKVELANRTWLELGSYTGNDQWACGTGWAEPRWSQALK